MRITNAEKKVLPFLSILRFVYFPVLLCFFEAVIHVFAYRSVSANLGWGLLFAIGIGSFLSFLTNVFPPMVNRVLTIVFTSLFTLIFEVQLVYYQIFKGFAPVSSIGLGAQAVTNFTDGLFQGIKEAILWILLLLLPLILLIAAMIRYRPTFRRRKEPLKAILPLIVSVFVLVGTISTMALFFSGMPSLYSMFTSDDTSTDTSVNCFGLTITMFQETRYMLFPKEDVIIVGEVSDTKYDSEIYQVDPSVDFNSLFEKAGDNDALKALTAKLSELPVTKKNEYTGLCEGYNIVALCCEAFSPEFITADLTPTLYKLLNGGFVFENFYSSFPNTTTNGEYIFTMGLFPDLSRTKVDSSFSISASNYLPYCYGNVFREAGGIAKAYHNYVGEFYYRNYTHPNMGYDFISANSGLDIEISWPASDHDMMINSVADYAYSGKQFAAYYMTFSGHYAYNLENAMSAKHWSKVQHLNYSDTVKAYIACNLELEYALTHLIETLEDAGVADKTMIVLTTDHFPYGLSDEQYSELAGREITNVFEKMKSAFICYVPGIEPVHVDSYCSSEDILPTVLNLLGVTYDSRLLAGEDVLSPDVEHIAVIADGSFISDGISYDAYSVSFTLDNNTTESRIRAEEMYALVNKKMDISVGILNNNYYSFVFDRESTSEGIDNITKEFTDVDIMKQAAVYYMMTNGYMDPISETKFGSYTTAQIDEVLNIAYRIAQRPKTHMIIDDIPYSTGTRFFEGSVVWAYEIGILDRELFPDDLTEIITIEQFARVLKTFAEYMGMDTSIDEAVLTDYFAMYPDTPEESARAAIFCGAHNLLNENGGDMDKVFYNPKYKLVRWYVCEEFYKICSYYLFT